MSAVFFEEKYDTEKAKSGIDEYDKTYKKYLSERSSNNRDTAWSKKISDNYIQLKGILNDDYALLKQQGFISIDKQ